MGLFINSRKVGKKVMDKMMVIFEGSRETLTDIIEIINDKYIDTVIKFEILKNEKEK